MKRPISFFTDYHQQENRVTNFCGLILKMLYQESPTKFEQVIQTLSECDVLIGPQFEQQSKRKVSVPDLSITQSSFSVFFETKLTDWFHGDQISRHIKGLEGAGKKILFLLSNFEEDDYKEKYRDLVKKEELLDQNVTVEAISFEEMLSSLDEAGTSESLGQLVADFGSYLDQQGLLPSWKYLLDVVNCAGTMDEIDAGFYLCPDTGGSYSHKRARYFGPYKNKQVSAIHEVEAVVLVRKNKESLEIKWNNSRMQTQEVLERAQKIIEKWPDWRTEENKQISLQIFILGDGFETNFFKNSPGGMFQSKKYFWDIARDVSDAGALAEKLNGKTWEEALAGK